MPVGVPGCALPPLLLPCSPPPQEISNHSIGTMNRSSQRSANHLDRLRRRAALPANTINPGKASHIAFNGALKIRAERASASTGAVVEIVNVKCVSPLPFLTCERFSVQLLKG